MELAGVERGDGQSESSGIPESRRQNHEHNHCKPRGTTASETTPRPETACGASPTRAPRGNSPPGSSESSESSEEDTIAVAYREFAVQSYPILK
jgi:hypothetical protein